MSMIFPGMNPYLEGPTIWPEVHSSLIVYIRDYLRPLLRPRYVATIEERVYVEGPDREIRPDVLAKRPHVVREPRGGVAVLEADAPVVLEGPPPKAVHESYSRVGGQRGTCCS